MTLNYLSGLGGYGPVASRVLDEGLDGERGRVLGAEDFHGDSDGRDPAKGQ